MIAFLVLAHHDPDNLRRLAERLHPHAVFVHLDAKTPWDQRWSAVPAHFVAPRHVVSWAGYSQVEATLTLLRSACQDARSFDRFVLLSGSCYPLRPVSDLEGEFQQHPGLNYIKYVRVKDSEHLPMLVQRYYLRDFQLPFGLPPKPWVRSINRYLRKAAETASRPIRRPLPLDFELVHGSAYWALTGECVRYILDWCRSETGIQVLKFYRHTFASDEQVFHSIIANSPFAAKATGLQPYLGRGTYRMANLHHVDPSLTKWFTIADLPALQNSKKFFVRKVRTQDSTALLDALDSVTTSYTAPSLQ